MSHSFATTANLTCTHCHQPYTADLLTILQELSQLARITDMLRHVELCQAAVTKIQLRQNLPLWAALQVVFANSLYVRRSTISSWHPRLFDALYVLVHTTSTYKLPVNERMFRKEHSIASLSLHTLLSLSISRLESFLQE